MHKIIYCGVEELNGEINAWLAELDAVDAAWVARANREMGRFDSAPEWHLTSVTLIEVVKADENLTQDYVRVIVIAEPRRS